MTKTSMQSLLIKLGLTAAALGLISCAKSVHEPYVELDFDPAVITLSDPDSSPAYKHSIRVLPGEDQNITIVGHLTSGFAPHQPICTTDDRSISCQTTHEKKNCEIRVDMSREESQTLVNLLNKIEVCGTQASATPAENESQHTWTIEGQLVRYDSTMAQSNSNEFHFCADTVSYLRQAEKMMKQALQRGDLTKCPSPDLIPLGN